MEWEQIESNWTELKHSIRLHWNKISVQQLILINGNRDFLITKIQNAYGIDKTEAENQLSEWQKSLINIDGHFYQSQPVQTYNAIHI